MKSILICSLSLGLICSAFSSAPIASSYVIQGWRTDCFLLMRPAAIDVEFSGIFSGIGTCYRIKEDGSFEKRWQIEGGYSFSNDVFLGGDGSILIRIVEVLPTPENKSAAKESILEFYKDGKLIKKFKAEDVVDPTKLKTVSLPTLPTYQIFENDKKNLPQIGYIYDFDWLSENDRSEIEKITDSSTEIFCIKTVQAEILVFKVSDGSLIYRKKAK